MAQTIDLGFQVPDYSDMAASPGSKDREKPKTKTAYPCLTISGNKALARSLQPDQEFTAVIKCRVTEVSIRSRSGDDDDDDGPSYGMCGAGGTRVEIEVQSIIPNGMKVEDSGDEEDGKTAFAKFMQSKDSEK